MAMKDLYSVLGVNKDADQASIKKSFKTLARKFHPDVNKDPGSSDRFKEITAAYEVLGDEQKRALYDEFGEASLRSGFDADQARAYKNMGGFRGGGYPGADGPQAGFGFEDLFSGMFNQGGGGAQRRSVRAGPDVEGRVEVSFMDAVRGAEVQIGVTRPGHCRVCSGEGGRGKGACAACKGSGRRSMRQFGMAALVQCDECGGSGSTFAEECDGCGGTGRVREPVTLNVRIPPGIESGKTIRLRGQGGEGRSGGPNGDLLLTVMVGEHALLRRKGKDLELDLPVRLAEAIGGATIEVPTPTGRVRVKVPPGSPNGRRLRVTGRGVQDRAGTPGDLYLVVRPVLPSDPGPEVVALAEQLDALTTADVRENLEL